MGLSVQAVSPECLLQGLVHAGARRTEAPSREPTGRAAAAGQRSPGLANTCSPHRCRAPGTCGPRVCWGCKWKTEPAKGPPGCSKEPLIAVRGCPGSRGQQPSHGGSHSQLRASRVPTREGQTGLTADAPLHMAFLGCGAWPGPQRPLGSARGGFHGGQASHGGQSTGSRITPTSVPAQKPSCRPCSEKGAGRSCGGRRRPRVQRSACPPGAGWQKRPTAELCFQDNHGCEAAPLL